MMRGPHCAPSLPQQTRWSNNKINWSESHKSKPDEGRLVGRFGPSRAIVAAERGVLMFCVFRLNRAFFRPPHP
jgi:hypothetical protein